MRMIPKKRVNEYKVIRKMLRRVKYFFESYDKWSDFTFSDIMKYLKGVNSDCLLSIIIYFKREDYKLYTPETIINYLYCNKDLCKERSGSRVRLTKMLENYIWYNYTSRLLRCDYEIAMNRHEVKICDFNRKRSTEQCNSCCSYKLSHVDTINTDLRITTTDIELLEKWSQNRKSILYKEGPSLINVEDYITKPMYYCNDCNVVCVFEDVFKECPYHRTLEKELQDALFNCKKIKKHFLPLKDIENETNEIIKCICSKCYSAIKIYY